MSKRITVREVTHYVITVEGTHRCSNDCDHMDIKQKVPAFGDAHIVYLDGEYVATCRLFNQKLAWDKRYTAHGYKRCKGCRELQECPAMVPDPPIVAEKA
jgi:hypothetical protein